MKSAYEIYCEWCRERGQTPPTKEWWDKACAACAAQKALTHHSRYSIGERTIAADQREIDRERREGWAYGQ